MGSRAGYLGALLGLALGLAACGSDEGDARAIWDLVNDEVHEVHVAAFADEAQPELVSSYSCASGGSMEMTLVYEGEAVFANLRSLLHVFRDCSLGDTLINGTLDYVELSFCDDGAPSFQIEGRVVLSGGLDADCQISGAELCGKASGTVCGKSAR